jgi:hypothetical protein
MPGSQSVDLFHQHSLLGAQTRVLHPAVRSSCTLDAHRLQQPSVPRLSLHLHLVVWATLLAGARLLAVLRSHARQESNVVAGVELALSTDAAGESSLVAVALASASSSSGAVLN